MATTGPLSYVVDDYWLCDYCDPCLAPNFGGGGAGHGGKKPHDERPKKHRALDAEPGADFTLVHGDAAAFLSAAAEPNIPAPVVEPVFEPLDLSAAHTALAGASSALLEHAQKQAAAKRAAAQLFTDHLQAQAAQRVKLAKIAAIVDAAERHVTGEH